MTQRYFYPLEVMQLRNDAGLAQGVLGASFGPVRKNNDGTPKNHQGWDLFAQVGTNAFAVADGVIRWTKTVQTGGLYGNQILLQFTKDATIASDGTTAPANVFAFYAHLSKVYVKAWDFVKAGQLIGLTGISGNAEAAYPHLHFELRDDPNPDLGLGLGGRRDPSEFLGGQLLSCMSTQIGEVDVRNLVCVTPTGTARPLSDKL